MFRYVHDFHSLDIIRPAEVVSNIHRTVVSNVHRTVVSNVHRTLMYTGQC